MTGTKNQNKVILRNGVFQKKVRTSSGNLEIAVPRDGVLSFNPSVVGPKTRQHGRRSKNVIISLYAKGIEQQAYIEEQIREVYNFDVSTSETIIKDNRQRYPGIS